MIILPTMPEVVLEQEIKILKARNIWRETNGNDYTFPLKRDFNYTFKRLLNNDQFVINIDAELSRQDSKTFWIPATNLNNNDDTIYNYSDTNFKNQMFLYQNGQFQINSQLLDKTKFSDLEMSMVGMDGGYHTSTYQSLRTVIFWQVFAMPKLIVSDFDHIIHLKIPKVIKVDTNVNKLGSDQNYHNYSYSHSSPGEYELDIKYLHFYLKPNLPSWSNSTQSLVDIYGYDESDEENSFNEDVLLFGNGKLKSTSVSSLKTSFTYDYDINRQYQVSPSQKAFYLGNITAQEAVYYDYEKQDVVKGFIDRSIFNDLIPYNFSGQYQWTLDLSLNEVLDDLTWNLHSAPLKPLLHPTNGQIKLTLDTDLEPKIVPEHSLTTEDLAIIRKYDDISLEGIYRFG